MLRVKSRGDVVADMPNRALTDEAPVYQRPIAEPGVSARTSQRSISASDAAASARRRRCRRARASRALLRASPDHRQQALDLPPVRSHGADQHHHAAGLRRRRRAHEGHVARAGDVGRWQRPLLLLDPRQRRDARGRRGGAQRRVRGRAPARRDQLPQLRQSRAARDHVAVRRGRRKASARPAARSTRRSPAATSASTTRPTAARFYPTPVIGVVGLLERRPTACSARRFPERRRCDIVLLGEGRGELGGSEYLKIAHGVVRGRAAGARSRARAGAAAARWSRWPTREPDSIGARLRRRRPGDRAGRVLLRHRGHRRGASIDAAGASSDASGVSDWRRRSSASPRRACSCASRPDDVARAARARRTAAGVPAVCIGRTGGSPSADRRRRRAVVDRLPRGRGGGTPGTCAIARCFEKRVALNDMDKFQARNAASSASSATPRPPT